MGEEGSCDSVKKFDLLKKVRKGVISRRLERSTLWSWNDTRSGLALGFRPNFIGGGCLNRQVTQFFYEAHILEP